MNNNYAEAIKLLPSKIELALNEPVISDLSKVVGEHRINTLLQFELTKLYERVGVGEYSTPAQMEFIAKSLIEMFPNETLADFKICFERGAMGIYGQIKFRLDGTIISQWFRDYLDQKYEVREKQWDNEKKTFEKPLSPDNSEQDWYQVWLESIGDNGIKAAPKMSDDEIQREGKERPKSIKHPSTPESLVKQKFMHDEWIRQNYDPYTGKPKDNWISEDEWSKSINE